MDRLYELFRQWSGSEPDGFDKIKAAGSDRAYFRLRSGDRSAIGVIGTSTEENTAFITLCRHLRSKELPVPELYAVSDDGNCYLQEDLGDLSLFDRLAECRSTGCYDEESLRLLENIARLLPDFQFKGVDGMDFSVCYPVESFDRRSILWDLNYFKYCFLKPSGLDFNEDRLEDSFDRLAGTLLRDAPYSTFMYRDLQSRNIMVRGDGLPWFIDFQGGRRGPIEYDLVSFLWQARAAYPAFLRERLIDVYIESLSKYRKINASAFRTSLDHFVLMRTLQVLGAYGYRGNFEHKAQFLNSIPAAISNLREVLAAGTGKDEYHYLWEILGKLTEMPQYQAPVQEAQDGKLTVRITSFSFRKGIPSDASGNGGGFVFDCRSMHNPGLYDEYKPLDGRSLPVIKFLEGQGEIQIYLDNVYGLVDPAVDKYLKRGFTNLMVSFGCTGGRHRSVCCAESLASHLHSKYGDHINIILNHREMAQK